MMELHTAGTALQILEALTMLLVVPLLVITVFVMSVVARSKPGRPERLHAGTGLLVAGVLLLTQVLGLALLLTFGDMEALLRFYGVEATPGQVPVVLAVAGFILLLVTGWRVLVFCAADGQWQLLRPEGRGLFRTPEARRPRVLGLAFGIGAAYAAFSLIVFHLVGVEVDPELERMVQQVFANTPMVVAALIALCTVLVAAVAEELAIRGAIFGALLRWAKQSPVRIVVAECFVSGLWAVLHISNTAMPAAKVAQIFIVGIIFCELARRKGLEAAVAGHLGLNVAAVLGETLGAVFGIIN